MRSIPMLLLALFLALGAGTATISCSTKTTVHTEERTNPDGSTSIVKTEHSEDDDDDGPHFGILSGTVKAIGWVLALPFKIVGGLISIIF